MKGSFLALVIVVVGLLVGAVVMFVADANIGASWTLLAAALFGAFCVLGMVLSDARESRSLPPPEG